LQQGESITNKRSIVRLGEKSYMNYQTTPLLSEVQDRVTNPAYCVEGEASENWIRGGVPSREMTRDTQNVR